MHQDNQAPCTKAEQHVFIIGAKSIGQYGGYETFVSKLLEQHENSRSIQYHIACKANGDGYMDETRLAGIEVLKKNPDGSVAEFLYRNAHVFRIPCPHLGPAVAIYYDWAALRYSLRYCRNNGITHAIFYILTCRIGPFIHGFKRKIARLGSYYYLNPDGHEWMRAKWPRPVRAYWKWSEKQMVRDADLVICDSVNIEKYIREEYSSFRPETTFIAYGSDTKPSALSDDDPEYCAWMQKNGLQKNGYYLVVGRFVPENNYETMLREFIRSNSTRDFVLITNVNEKFLGELEEKLHYRADSRIKFVGTVYDAELLKKIRENAYAYFHGHEVGGTNPSLLEALGSTELNLLLDVGFNREVGQDAALYWSKDSGNLAALIEQADQLSETDRAALGERAKNRIRQAYTWPYIAGQYKSLWLQRRS